MNSQIITRQPIKKLCISSNDRINRTDDSSGYTVNFNQICNVNSFIIRKGFIPLSTYTFSSDLDPDRTLEYGTAPAPNGPSFVNASGAVRYMNFTNTIKKQNPAYPYGGFDQNEGIIVRKDSVFKQGFTPGTTNSIQLRIWNEWSEQNGQSYVKSWPLNYTRYYTTIAADLYFFCQGTVYPEFYLRDLRIQTNWENFYLTNPQCQNQAGDKITYINPDNDYDPDRDVFYFYNVGNNPQTTTSFNIGYYYWNSATNKYDKPVPRGSVENVIMSEINVKNPNGNKIYTFRPNAENCNYDKETIGFLPNTVFTNQSIVDYLNTNVPYSRFQITFSKTALQPGTPSAGEKLVIATPANTGWRKIYSADPLDRTRRRLGLQYSVSSTIYWDDTPPVSLAPINLYLEVVSFFVAMQPGTTTWTKFLSDFHTALSNKSIESGIALQTELEYLIPTTTSTFVPNLNFYAMNMNSGANNIYSMYFESMSTIPRNVFILSDAANYTIGKNIDQGLVPSDGLQFFPYVSTFTTPQNEQLWSTRVPIINVLEFDTGILYTEATLLTKIQTITTTYPNLIFSIVNHKLRIQNTSQSTAYVLYNNTRMGIYDDAGFIVIPPESTITAPNIVDISSNNDVIYISLSCYNNGSNSINPDGSSRVLKNICCSAYNSRDVNYGAYIEYTDDSANWLDTNCRDLSSIRVDIYDTFFEPLILNGISTHFEIDFK